MPRISREKAILLGKFEEAMRLSGWNVLYLTHREHPPRYRVFKDDVAFTLKVYLWNITPGGRSSLPNEFRIQRTIDPTSEPGVKTLVLGWWPEGEVFGAWDIRAHDNIASSSPSNQISRQALVDALHNGFAPYVNQNGETAIAIRPDFMGTYVMFTEALHDSGSIPKEAKLLKKLGDDPDTVSEAEIKTTIKHEREFAIVTTKKALRAIDFAQRVLSAYDHRCAMCGVQLELIDGAHILPVAEPGSTDETNNGIALCALHHRAYDKAVVTFRHTDLSIVLNEARLEDLKDAKRVGGLKEFRAALKPVLFIPASKGDRPKKQFVTEANALRGWSFS